MNVVSKRTTNRTVEQDLSGKPNRKFPPKAARVASHTGGQISKEEVFPYTSRTHQQSDCCLDLYVGYSFKPQRALELL